MRDNLDSSPDIIESRYRSRRDQTNLNVEVGLVNKQTFNSGNTAANSAGGGGAISGTGLLTAMTGGTSPRQLCFLGETGIDLFSGAIIRIDRITDRFTVLNFDEDGNPCEDKIVAVHRRTVFEYMRVGFGGGVFTRVLGAHLYKTPAGEYVPIEDLFNRHVVGRDGEAVPVTRLEPVNAPEGVEVYTLSCGRNPNYVANGHRVKNAKVRPDDRSF